MTKIESKVNEQIGNILKSNNKIEAMSCYSYALGYLDCSKLFNLISENDYDSMRAKLDSTITGNKFKD